MDLSRRSFLKTSLVGAVGILIPIKLQLGYSHEFNPTHECGNVLPLAKEYRYDSLPQTTMDMLHKDARSILPRGTAYELRGRVPTNFGFDKAVAWYYNPQLDDKQGRNPYFDEVNGYYFISQHYA